MYQKAIKKLSANKSRKLRTAKVFLNKIVGEDDSESIEGFISNDDYITEEDEETRKEFKWVKSKSGCNISDIQNFIVGA